jgi:DNA segregation ATPase FtsK/SpoIIIE, S-DNA-T family
MEQLKEAAKLIVTLQSGSISLLQRRMGLNYAEASAVMQELETLKIVGPFEGNKNRNVLISNIEEIDNIFNLK